MIRNKEAFISYKYIFLFLFKAAQVAQVVDAVISKQGMKMKYCCLYE